jgi:DNA gyrase/topoisomerase IV subunit A
MIIKNQKVATSSNPLGKFGLLTLGLILVIIVYGGLSINRLQKQNQALVSEQTQLENKIAGLGSTIADNQNKIDDLSSNLQENNNQLATYKKLTSSLQNEVSQAKLTLANNTVPTPIDQAVSPTVIKPIVKTVTKKVYVKETPKSQATVTIQNIGSYKVDLQTGDTAFKILQRASEQNNFDLKTTNYGGDLGYMVDSIGGIKPAGNQYWSFYYDGQYAQVGASSQTISAGDATFWELASF